MALIDVAWPAWKKYRASRHAQTAEVLRAQRQALDAQRRELVIGWQARQQMIAALHRAGATDLNHDR
jgi:hypothetical protein